MKIAIIGLGFVGLSLTSVLASKGFNIVGIDVDKEKCKNISNGVSPFFEPNLEKTLKKGLKNKLQIGKEYFLLVLGGPTKHYDYSYKNILKIFNLFNNYIFSLTFFC